MSDKACNIDTYIAADASESDGFQFSAMCNGGPLGECGWFYDLRDSSGVDHEEWLRLDELHRRHSATVSITAA